MSNTPAGNYGSGKRIGGVSTLVCAVLDDRPSEGGDDEQKYESRFAGLTYIHHFIADTTHLFVSVRDCLLQTMYRYERSFGKSGILRTHPPSFPFPALKS